MTLVAFLIVLTLSVVFTSFVGHFVHWSLHQRWAGPFRRGHMSHHLAHYPPHDLVSDKYRAPPWFHSGPLLFAPVFFVIMAAAGAFTWWLGWPAWVTVTLCSVILGFGFFNDYVHDSYHIVGHWMARFGWWERGRTLHFVHHRNMKVNFGIFSFTWDKVFDTFKAWVKQSW